jgi:hypothetical protein
VQAYEAVALIISILEVPGSIIGRDTDYPEEFSAPVRSSATISEQLSKTFS